MADLMRAQRRWYDQLWVVVLLTAVLAVGMRLLFGSSGGWIYAVIGGASYALVAGLFIRRRQRKDAKASGNAVDDLAVLDRRIRRTELPDDPEERAALARMIEQRRTLLNRRRAPWAAAFLFVMFMAIGVLSLVVGNTVAGLSCLVGGVVFTGWIVWYRRTHLARMDHLQRQLDTTQGSVSPTPAGPAGT